MLALRMLPSESAPHAAAEASARMLELCLQRTVVVAVLRHTDCEESGTSFADVTVSDVLGTSFTAACGGPGTS